MKPQIKIEENKIIDLERCQYSSRHGRYGGNAGSKDGILINNEPWIVKYPKSTIGMKGNNLPSYTTAPLSEYIGSHIYEKLGIPVHETALGIRKGKLVVACKDFQKVLGDLAEVRQLKNSILEDDNINTSITGDAVILEELYYHFDNNVLMNREDLKNQFYTMMIIDILINNNDRNNGNWGLLYNNDSNAYDLAPVYDNGNAFYNKADDKKLLNILNNDNADMLKGSRTIYQLNGINLSVKALLNLNDNRLKDNLINNMPIIINKMPEIIDFINNIPEQYEGIKVMSKIMKEAYINNLNIMKQEVLYPKYVEIAQEKGIDICNIQK